MPNEILEYILAMTWDEDGAQATRNSSDGRRDMGNNNIPERSFESMEHNNGQTDGWMDRQKDRRRTTGEQESSLKLSCQMN